MAWGARHWRLLAAVASVPLPALVAQAQTPAPAPAAGENVFSYHRPDVLGTTLDLKIIAASQGDADACQQTITEEIQRLNQILSTYDAGSEISKFQANTSTAAITVSPDLHAVLLGYYQWHAKSGGVYSAQLGELIDFWKQAEKTGALPTDADLAPLLARVRTNAYVASLSGNEIYRKTFQPLNVDSLGKGYIVQKAAGVAKAKYASVTGIMLNIGGDITVMGLASPPSVTPAAPWEITVADPLHPANNAPPLTTLHLSNKAVATSGSYERYYTFGGKKYSHILNPQTGRPSDNDVLQATVVAPDNMTANAVATILCVIPPADGIRLVERTPSAAALIVMADGKQIRSKGFAAYENAAESPVAGPSAPAVPKPPAPPQTPAPAIAGAAWPKGFALNLDLTVLPFRGPANVPYICVWIEDSSGKPIKILAAWIGNKKYMPAMQNFQKVSQKAPDFSAMTRPTKKAGEYSFIWDGTDSTSAAVPSAAYNVCVEVGYEHGGHQFQKLALNCGTEKVSDFVPASNYFSKVPVTYGPGR